jgi:serine/threonine protein kinase
MNPGGGKLDSSQTDRPFAAESAAAVAPNPVIPDHQLLGLIASGAYGEVWLARNAVGTLRAVKIVRRDRHTSAESFEREFKGLQKFEPVSRAHEGLVDILTLGLLNDGAGFYYVMELADAAEPRDEDGQSKMEDNGSFERGTRHPPSSILDPQNYAPRTLRADLKSRGALPADDVIALGLKLTAALAHLHAHGLVHRDVKPSNILFISGEPKLADAGLVAALDDARSLVGTAGYIAPEGPGSPQADLYALGKVLYEAAFGKDRQEFPALPANVAARPDHARLLELNEIIATACAHDPKQRYADAEAIHADLEVLDKGQSVKRKRTRQENFKHAIRFAAAAVLIGILYLTATKLLPSLQSVGELRSSNPEVNRLVDQGNLFLLSETPERDREALESFRKAADLDPSFVPAHYGMYNVLMLDVESRRTIAATLMKLAPESAEAHIAYNHVLWDDWHFKEALEDARLTTKRRYFSKMAHARSYMAYGYMLVHSGYPEKALEQYQIARDISGADSQIERHLGHPYFAQRKFDQALKHYDQSIFLNPNHWVGHNWRGNALEELGDFEKAISAFETCDLVRGKDAAITKSYHDSLRDAYRRGGPEGYWRKRLHDALAEAKPRLYDIASLYARLGDKPKAYEYLEKACEQRAFPSGLLFDACWDKNDERFQAIARRIGLMR